MSPKKRLPPKKKDLEPRPAGELPGQEKVSEAFTELLIFEEMLSELSARFIHLPVEHIDGEIELALKMILQFLKVDRCGMLKLAGGRQSWIITHAAVADDSPPIPLNTELPAAIHPWAFDKLIRKQEVVCFTQIDDLPFEADVDKKTYIEWGIRSNLVIPILMGEEVGHVIAIDAVKSERVWPEKMIPRLKLLGQIFVNALERGRAELALRESKERLSLATTAAEMGLWGMEAKTESVWATERLREIFQFAPDEALNFSRFMERIHPDDRGNVRTRCLQSMEKRELLKVDYRILRPDGNIRWITSRGGLFPRMPGQDCLMGVSIDITERKRLENQLREQLAEITQLKSQVERENICLRAEIKREKGFEKFVGQSDALKYVLFRASQVASTDATVLILGETGTGKGMVARAIHEMSARKDKPMVTVNCAALPANLIESELFGREKGAFTGAHARQVGRFEIADRGTIFLDEIGEMPLELQTKLLRVLQDGEFERLGSPNSIKVDVRVIAATSRDLKADAQNGRFREDLYYRLNIFIVSIPPLRARAEDIPRLVNHFVEKYARKYGKRFETVSRDAIQSLQAYPWPGNVRELESVMMRAIITSPGPVLRLADQLECGSAGAGEGQLQDLEAMERGHIQKVLERTRWKIGGEGGAASILGLNPSTLRFRIKKLGIQRT